MQFHYIAPEVTGELHGDKLIAAKKLSKINTHFAEVGLQCNFIILYSF